MYARSREWVSQTLSSSTSFQMVNSCLSGLHACKTRSNDSLIREDETQSSAQNLANIMFRTINFKKIECTTLLC